ncbi:hypothetical protein Bbelb_111490 [Branchiostoma belcheri]|nr:hypothetical protein Bbelb_111490 [Branchiostoma belcheri]
MSKEPDSVRPKVEAVGRDILIPVTDSLVSLPSSDGIGAISSQRERLKAQIQALGKPPLLSLIPEGADSGIPADDTVLAGGPGTPQTTGTTVSSTLLPELSLMTVSTTAGGPSSSLPQSTSTPARPGVGQSSLDTLGRPSVTTSTATGTVTTPVVQQSALPRGKPSAPASAGTPTIVVPLDRKLPRFTGTDPGVSFEEWWEDVRAVFSAWGTTTDQQAHMVWRHLEGEARREARRLSADERGDITTLVGALRDAYQDTAASTTLLSRFYGREQGQNETARQYALELQDLVRRAERRQPGSVPSQDKTLRDRFIAGLRDKTLVPALKAHARHHPDCTFMDIRREADELAVGRPAAKEVTALGACASTPSGSSEATGSQASIQSSYSWHGTPEDMMRGLVELRRLNAELIQLNATLAGQTTQAGTAQPPAYNGSAGGQQNAWGGSQNRNSKPYGQNRGYQRHRFTADGRPICSLCNLVGHMGRRCTQGNASGGDQGGRLSEPPGRPVEGTGGPSPPEMAPN